MAWTDPAGHVWTTGEVVTAANMNTFIRLNLQETAPAKVTTAGDTVYAAGANAISRLAVGASGQVLTSDGSAPQWSDHYTHAVEHSDSGSDPLVAASVTATMVAGDLLEDLILYGYNEVSSASVSTTKSTVASVALTIPAGWTTWRCWAMATFGYNTWGVGSFHGIIRIDGTDTQDQNVDTPSDFIAPGAVVGHRTGMVTTGARTIAFQVFHGGASGTGVVTDINLFAQAYRVN